MNSVWSNKWKNILIWFSAYSGFTAFALVGGYVILKEQNEELRKNTKVAFVVTLIFAAISAFLSVFYNFMTMSSSYYDSGLYDFYNIFSKIVSVGKIVVFAVFVIMELTKKENEKVVEEN